LMTRAAPNGDCSQRSRSFSKAPDQGHPRMVDRTLARTRGL
jgi:hypothetical protein